MIQQWKCEYCFDQSNAVVSCKRDRIFYPQTLPKVVNESIV